MAMGQLWGLGIRHKLLRQAVWFAASVMAAVLATVALALAVVPYLAVCGYALRRLAGNH